MADSKIIRVFFVDDQPLMRLGIQRLLDEVEDVRLCGEAGTLRDAEPAIKQANPNVLITDFRFSHGAGYEGLEDLCRAYPQLPVLIYSLYGEALHAERALRAGAMGFVMRNQPLDVLVPAIRKVAAGERAVSQGLAFQMMDRFVESGGHDQRTGVDRLSNRELAIFRCIGHGMSNREISDQYSLSIKTIETYRSRIKTKLGLEDATKLMHAAILHVHE